MPEIKSDILNEFDIIIADLQTLLAGIPDGLRSRYSRGNEDGLINQDKQDIFMKIRTRALKLLTRIDSKDENLRLTKEYIRDVDPIRFNIESMLRELEKLRSDYESEILTLHPHLPEFPMVISGGKHKWMDKKKNIVNFILFTLVGGIIVTVVSELIIRWLW